MSGEVELEEGSSNVQRMEKMIETPIICFRRRMKMILFVLLLSWRLRSVRIPTLNEIVDDDHLDDDDGGGSSEVRADDSDIEADSTPSCRICLESDGDADDELISPCMCKGTLQFVHRSCLDHWRSVREGFDFSHCTTCKAQFHLRIESSDNSLDKLKFRLFITRDVLLVFLAVQTASLLARIRLHSVRARETLCVVGLILGHGSYGLIDHCFNLNRRHPEIECCQCCCVGCGFISCCFAPIGGYYYALAIVCVIIFGVFGITYGLLDATMLLQRLWQKHYHIITKKELTKQYIVEHLHSCYTPPKLDRKHKERLRMLKLF